MNKSIYVALSLFADKDPKALELLQASGISFELNKSGRRLDKAQLLESAKGCAGVIAGLEPYDKDVLQRLPDLKCISRCGVGVDNIDLASARSKGVAVMTTPDAVTQPVAELTIAMIFDLLRRLSWHAKQMGEKRWERSTGSLLKGKTVGLIGLGRIGRRVAELLTALGAQVVAYDPKPDLDWARSHQTQVLDLEPLLARSEIVSLHFVHDDKQPFCLDEKRISQMPKGAILINTARGSFVDEDALFEALSKGKLAAAGLDVFAQEPYQGALCTLDNVILTPHIGSLTQESRCDMEMQAVKNLLDFLNK